MYGPRALARNCHHRCGNTKSTISKSSAEGGSSKTYPELRLGMITFPGVLDYTRNVWTQLTAIESLAVDNLMEFEPDGKVKPGLASSVEQPNKTTYVYHLKSVKFSDGRPLTAADVVFSLDRNVDAKEAWDKAYWQDVASIYAQNDSTVVVKLKQPSAVFQDIVAFTGEIIEKAAAEKVSEKELGTPGHMLVGTGPWKVVSYKPEVAIQLSRNPYWSGSQQPAERINITLFKTEASMALALRSGAVEGTFFYQIPKAFANIPSMHELTAPGSGVTFGVANTKLAPFNNVHVRRALVYATDAAGMISALYPHGTAIEDPTIMPANLFANLGTKSEITNLLSALPKYEFNLAKAKEELAKSPYPNGFTTEIAAEQIEAAAVSDSEILSSDLAKIGITAKVHPVSPSDVPSAIFGGKSKIVVDELPGIYPDPEAVLSTILAPSQINPPGSGLNVANYRNAQVDRQLSESPTVTNAPKRLD